MKTITAYAFLSLLLCCASAAHALTFDFADVGNAGNVGKVVAPSLILGDVAYNYRISKTEVTNAQYTEFLNAVDPTGANSLDLYDLNQAGNFGGIENTGTTDGARYVTQAGREQNPVAHISWYDAVRFINWLHNGQGSGDTETGAYSLLGGTATPSNGTSVTRNFDATFWLPSENEWFKAAYHNASAGTAASYFTYATGSSAEPVSDHPDDNPAAVNYNNNDNLANGFNDGYAVSGSTTFPSSTNPFTDVGAYTEAVSPYGTFDQSGNVWEWNESIVDVSFRGLRGGSWAHNANGLSSRSFGSPLVNTEVIGFRVATIAIPEPSTLLLMSLVSVAQLRTVRRRNSQLAN